MARIGFIVNMYAGSDFGVPMVLFSLNVIDQCPHVPVREGTPN